VREGGRDLVVIVCCVSENILLVYNVTYRCWCQFIVLLMIKIGLEIFVELINVSYSSTIAISYHLYDLHICDHLSVNSNHISDL
jgi:hypothetical protein